MEKRAGVFIGTVFMLVLVVVAVLPVQAKTTRRCSYSGCCSKIYDGSKYCSRHTCHVTWGCSSAVWKDGSHVSKYCKAHNCKEDDCYRPIADEGKEYCRTHRRFEKTTSTTCEVKGCTRTKESGSYYCSTHTCKKSGCKSYAVSKGYCYQHKSSSSSKSSSSGKSSSKKKSRNYDSYYEDDPEAYYEDNKDLYDSYDDAMDDWEDEYGDDY